MEVSDIKTEAGLYRHVTMETHQNCNMRSKKINFEQPKRPRESYDITCAGSVTGRNMSPNWLIYEWEYVS